MLIERDPKTNLRRVDGEYDPYTDITLVFEGAGADPAQLHGWVRIDTEQLTIEFEEGRTEELRPAVHRIVRLRNNPANPKFGLPQLRGCRLWPDGPTEWKDVERGGLLP